jgi:hypothetical protein
MTKYFLSCVEKIREGRERGGEKFMQDHEGTILTIR